MVFLSMTNPKLDGKFALGGTIDGVLSLYYATPLYSEISLTQVFSKDHIDKVYECSYFNQRYCQEPIIGDVSQLITSDSLDEIKKKYDLIKDIIIGSQMIRNTKLFYTIGEFVPVRLVYSGSIPHWSDDIYLV